MPNEITAEMLAREMSLLNGTGDGPGWEHDAGVLLLATRAYAALQAQPTEAPGRVRCWYVKALQSITLDEPGAFMLSRDGYTVTPGHFIPDTEAHE